MGTSIQEQPINTALSAIFAAHSGIDGAQPPELSAEARTENYAAAIAAGVEDNGSVAGLAIVETQKQIRLEKEEKKKQQAAMMSELEKQTQRIINDLQAQIDELQEELDDKRREEARLSQDETDILFLTQLAQTDSFDMSNPEHREVYERALIENPDLIEVFNEGIERSQQLKLLNEALESTQGKLLEVQGDISNLEEVIEARTNAMQEIRANPDNAREILEHYGIEGIEADLNATDIRRALRGANLEVHEQLEVSTASLVELSVEEEIGLFMRNLAMFENGELHRDQIIEGVTGLSDSAREQIHVSNPELDNFMSGDPSVVRENDDISSIQTDNIQETDVGFTPAGSSL